MTNSASTVSAVTLRRNPLNARNLGSDVSREAFKAGVSQRTVKL
jgi:hypothetical protein